MVWQGAWSCATGSYVWGSAAVGSLLGGGGGVGNNSGPSR